MRPPVHLTLLIVGGALAQIAAGAPIAWGMILGSGVDLGGSFAEQWLQNVSVASLAAGALTGGLLMDRGREIPVVVGGCAALCLGLIWGGRAPGSELAVMAGLGGLGSFGAGVFFVVGVSTVARHAGPLRGVAVGLTLGVGQLSSELVWGSASLLSLTRGAGFVLGWVALIASVTAVLGGGALVIASRMGKVLEPLRFARLPRWGPAEGSFREKESPFDDPRLAPMLALAFAASFCGLLAMRSGTALSLEGVPEDSFASGVLVGRSFALWRAAGIFVGGLLHDLLGPRSGIVASSLALACVLLLITGFTGRDNPWGALMSAAGVASGYASVSALVATAHLFDTARLGSLVGALYLSAALGTVMVLPLLEIISRWPRGALGLTGMMLLGLALSGWLMGRRARA